MLSAVELEGGLCLVTATHRGVMPILLRSSRPTAGSYADITTKLATHCGVMPILLRSSRRAGELCRYYYEARDAQGSYADITTKLATRRELCRYYYEARDAQGSYADITTKLATQCGVLPILGSTKHITLYMVWHTNLEIVVDPGILVPRKYFSCKKVSWAGKSQLPLPT